MNKRKPKSTATAKPSPRFTGSVAPSVDEMDAALVKAKWKKHGTLWIAPDGRIYRGPALAYHMMMGLQWPPPNGEADLRPSERTEQ